MSNTPDLTHLFDRLRNAGILVGVTEVLRLQRVLSFDFELDFDRLQRVIVGVVAKSHEQVETAEHEIRSWWQEQQRLMPLAGREPLRPPIPRPSMVRDEENDAPTKPFRFRRFLRLALPVVALELLVFGLLWPLPGDNRVRPGVDSGGNPIETRARQPDSPDISPKDSERHGAPTEPEPVGRDWTPLFLAANSGALALGLWFVYVRRFAQPAAAPKAIEGGPIHYQLPILPEDTPPMFDSAESAALVWGVEHFVAATPSPRLDMAASVRATTRAAGRPVLEYERSKHPREVWLWVDDLGHRGIEETASALEKILTRSGLVVETARFAGVPDVLDYGTLGRRLPTELDERSNTAIVLVLSDCRGFERALGSATDRHSILALLQLLSSWPRLTTVAFETEATNALEDLLGLSVIQPHQIVQFLGGPATPPPKFSQRTMAAWRAACDLAPQPLSPQLAQALWGALGNRNQTATGIATKAPPRSALEQRAQRLDWLRRTSRGPKGQEWVAPQSDLDRALDFWEGRLEPPVQESSSESPADQRRRIDHALIRLWRNPTEAVQTLSRLARAGHLKTIEALLDTRAPADFQGVAIRMPWRIEDLPASSRDSTSVMLSQSGFGAKLEGFELPNKLKYPARLWLALGLCGGLTLAALLGWIAQENGSLPPIAGITEDAARHR